MSHEVPRHLTNTGADPLRVAVIGLGPIGLLHAEAVSQSNDASLIAVCDIEASAAQRAAQRFAVAAFHSIEQLLETVRPDAVCVATPNHLHVEPCQHALNAGCSVFCEKPLATDFDDASKLVRCAEQVGRQLSVDHNRRFAFGYQRAKQWLDEGRIGKLNALTFHVSDRIPPPHVAADPTAMLSSLLVHHLDLIRWFAGDPLTVHCQIGQRIENLIRQFHLTLKLRSGAVATLTGVYRAGQSRTRELAILDGEAGEIRVEDATHRAVISGTDSDHEESVRPNLFHQGDRFYQTVHDHVQDFCRQLRLGQSVTVTGADHLLSLSVAEAARESCKLRKTVEIPDPVGT